MSCAASAMARTASGVSKPGKPASAEPNRHRFWPFAVGQGPLSWRPGAGLAETVLRYWSFYLVTSAGWDAAGALAHAVLIALTGAALLSALRRLAPRLTPWAHFEKDDVSTTAAGATL